MQPFIRLVILSILVLFSTTSFSSDPQTDVRQLLQYFADQWNDGELDSVKNVFHRDFVLVTSEIVRTKEQRLDEL